MALVLFVRQRRRQSAGSQQAVSRQSAGSQQAVSRESAGSQQAVSRQSAGSQRNSDKPPPPAMIKSSAIKGVKSNLNRAVRVPPRSTVKDRKSTRLNSS